MKLHAKLSYPEQIFSLADSLPARTTLSRPLVNYLSTQQRLYPSSKLRRALPSSFPLTIPIFCKLHLNALGLAQYARLKRISMPADSFNRWLSASLSLRLFLVGVKLMGPKPRASDLHSVLLHNAVYSRSLRLLDENVSQRGERGTS